MEFEIKCEVCGRTEIIILSSEQADKFRDFIDEEISFDEFLETIDEAERNLIKNSLCSECYSKYEKENKNNR
jgi:hypothetical protein